MENKMNNNKTDINKTKYRYFLDNANKFLNKTAITYSIPIENCITTTSPFIYFLFLLYKEGRDSSSGYYR